MAVIGAFFSSDDSTVPQKSPEGRDVRAASNLPWLPAARRPGLDYLPEAPAAETAE
jgi:hypothetical protein